MNLWLDDVRPAPPGWTWARTAKEARDLLATGTVEDASLDHDLGSEVTTITPSGIAVAGAIESAVPDENGTALVRWMAENRALAEVQAARPLHEPRGCGGHAAGD